jgi:urease accessory protein
MRKWLFASPVLLLFEPTAASAHSVWTGAGAFWAGFSHPLTSIDQVCFLLALAIWLIFSTPRARSWTLGVIATVPILTAAISWWSGRELSTLTAMAALMIVAGLGAAARLNIHGAILVAFAAIGAGLIGVETGQAIGTLAPAAFIMGAALSPVVVMWYLFAGMERMTADWQSIACRALASWIAAVGIMMLTFQLWQPHLRVHTTQVMPHEVVAASKPIVPEPDLNECPTKITSSAPRSLRCSV